MVATDCSATHNSEYAGLFEPPDAPYPADKNARDQQNLNGCRPVLANYTGIPNDSNFQYRLGTIWFPFGKEDWELGNRGVRCYLYVSSRPLTGSGKGAGTTGFPINYRK
jgi:hypothetical protein